MSTLHATIRPLPHQTQLLVTDRGNDCLRAVLPPHPCHPRALPTLLEGLTLWHAQPLHAVLVAEDRSGPGPVATFFDEALWPHDLAQVHFDVQSRRRPRRLRGPGDFRTLYRLHGDRR